MQRKSLLPLAGALCLGLLVGLGVRVQAQETTKAGGEAGGKTRAGSLAGYADRRIQKAAGQK